MGKHNVPLHHEIGGLRNFFNSQIKNTIAYGIQNIYLYIVRYSR